MTGISQPTREKDIMRNPIFRKATSASLTLLLLGLAACATESYQALDPPKPASAGTSYTGARSTLMVGKFDNRTSYLRGLFSGGVDRLGGQAKTILIGHLQETGRFGVVDRDNLDEIAREAQIKGQQQALKGADFAITGDVVDVLTSEVVYSAPGAGEYALSNRELLGFGGTAGYDSTLNGKVLDLAIREAINRLVESLEQGKWKPAKETK